MPKVITSPITRWPGTVTIADPLTIPQAQMIEAGMKQPDAQEGERVWLTVIDAAKLPAVIGCVEKWELENFKPDPFPASPRGDSHKLIDWIFREMLTVYFGEAIVPNE
jgi:hypothetical protein